MWIVAVGDGVGVGVGVGTGVGVGLGLGVGPAMTLLPPFILQPDRTNANNPSPRNPVAFNELMAIPVSVSRASDSLEEC